MEAGEVTGSEECLAHQRLEDEMRSSVKSAVMYTGAASIRYMGKVMGVLKSKYTGQVDFGLVGPMVKDELCSEGGC